VTAIRGGEIDIEAATVVLASGVATQRLADMAQVNIPLKESQGVLVHTRPQPKLVDRVVLAPGVHCKQKLDGRVVVGGKVVAGAGTADDEAPAPGEYGQRILREAARVLPGIRGVAVERVTVGRRVMPADEYPVIGFSDLDRAVGCTRDFGRRAHQLIGAISSVPVHQLIAPVSLNLQVHLRVHFQVELQDRLRRYCWWVRTIFNRRVSGVLLTGCAETGCLHGRGFVTRAIYRAARVSKQSFRTFDTAHPDSGIIAFSHDIALERALEKAGTWDKGNHTASVSIGVGRASGGQNFFAARRCREARVEAV